MAGSIFSEVTESKYKDTPDIDSVDDFKSMFTCIQEMISNQKILSIHDISDGGLITSLLEMCFTKKVGMRLDLSGIDNINEQLFSEESGFVIQVKKDKLLMSDGTVLNIDKSILSTNAMAPKWIKNSDIQLNEESFIVVNNAFQTNHNFIFAAGDIVDFNNENLKKAGVFAVRSGKPLAKSLRNYILNGTSYTYKFNKNYLALIGLANGLAIATKYNFSYSTKTNFYLKKFIDKRFIKKFNNLNNNKIFCCQYAVIKKRGIQGEPQVKSSTSMDSK